MPRIAILTDKPGWHGRELKRAFKARGMQVSYVNPRACRFDLSRPDGMILPGFARALPDAVLVREIPGGSFQQVTLRLDFLHALQELGVPVYNSVRAIEKSVDKAMTSFLLQRAAVPTLPTWVTEDAAQARAIVMRETAQSHDVVLKPLFGSQGKGLQRLTRGSHLPPAPDYDGVYYLQRFLDTGQDRWHDWRVFVVGDRAVAAMHRHGKSWISNIAQGARAQAAPVTPQLAQLAVAATHAVGLDYAGVDIISAQVNQYYVLEVNSIPAWYGLQKVTPFSIADLLAQDLLDRKLRAPLRASA